MYPLPRVPGTKKYSEANVTLLVGAALDFHEATVIKRHACAAGVCSKVDPVGFSLTAG